MASTNIDRAETPRERRARLSASLAASLERIDSSPLPPSPSPSPLSSVPSSSSVHQDQNVATTPASQPQSQHDDSTPSSPQIEAQDGGPAPSTASDAAADESTVGSRIRIKRATVTKVYIDGALQSIVDMATRERLYYARPKTERDSITMTYMSGHLYSITDRVTKECVYHVHRVQYTGYIVRYDKNDRCVAVYDRTWSPVYINRQYENGIPEEGALASGLAIISSVNDRLYIFPIAGP
ncbi:hypothetical protein F4802DRAFT_594327 [Xylaria palmicola]|nr:hypothetical protein F4802DRAFT_594327 [Xylaria palmicola]